MNNFVFCILPHVIHIRNIFATFNFLSIYLSIYLSTSLPIYLSICLSICGFIDFLDSYRNLKYYKDRTDWKKASKVVLNHNFFCFVFGGSPWYVSKPIDIVLAIWKQDILLSFILFLFREHGLKFGSRDSHRNALLGWITFQWDVEYIPFPHISTYVLSYVSRRYRIISSVDLL